MTEKSAAVLTIFDADIMTKKGKNDIAQWLRRQASLLLRDGDKYARRFRARYLYLPHVKKSA
jgi:hypothetical protein